MSRPPATIVAIVEDDEGMRHAIRRLLETEGFRTELFASAEAFLSNGTESRVRCLVLDIGLPGMSGIELHERLLSSNRAVPTIFITAHESVYARRLAKCGMDCLVKPFLGEALVDRVKRAIDA